MKWDVSAIDSYSQHQAYIDTAIIPFVSVQAGGNMRESVTKAAWISRVTNSLEEQLTGRVMLFPVFSYTGLEDDEALILNANTYFRSLEEDHFRYVICLTLDKEWKKREDQLLARFMYPPFEAEKQDLSALEASQSAQELVQKLIAIWKNT